MVEFRSNLWHHVPESKDACLTFESHKCNLLQDCVVDVMLVTHLAVFSILYILLSVQEPVWDFVLARILHDGHHALNLET